MPFDIEIIPKTLNGKRFTLDMEHPCRDAFVRAAENNLMNVNRIADFHLAHQPLSFALRSRRQQVIGSYPII